MTPSPRPTDARGQRQLRWFVATALGLAFWAGFLLLCGFYAFYIEDPASSALQDFIGGVGLVFGALLAVCYGRAALVADDASPERRGFRRAGDGFAIALLLTLGSIALVALGGALGLAHARWGVPRGTALAEAITWAARALSLLASLLVGAALAWAREGVEQLGDALLDADLGP